MINWIKNLLTQTKINSNNQNFLLEIILSSHKLQNKKKNHRNKLSYKICKAQFFKKSKNNKNFVIKPKKSKVNNNISNKTVKIVNPNT